MSMRVVDDGPSGDEEAPTEATPTADGDDEGKEEGASQFTTMHVTMLFDRSMEEQKLREFLQWIEELISPFPGFKSRRIVELPNEGERQLLVLLKFEGCTVEEAFHRLQAWAHSPERHEVTRRATELGIRTEKQVEKGPVGTLVLRKKQSDEHVAPAKWKIGLVVLFWLYPLILLQVYSGSGDALDAFFGNAPLSLLTKLVISVPILSYLALPLTLSVPLIAGWLSRRSRTHNAPCLSALEDGLELFRPEDPPKTISRNAISRRFSALERRVLALSREQEQEHPDLRKLPAGFFKEPEIESACADRQGVLTIAAKHKVRIGMTREFARWTSRIEAQMHAIPQFHGMDVIKLEEEDEEELFEEDDYYTSSVPHVVLFRFETLAAARKWLVSSERSRALDELETIVAGPSEYDTLADFFCNTTTTPAEKKVVKWESDDRCEKNLLGELLFSESESSTKQPQPALYKVTILTTLGIFLVAWPIGYHLGPVLAGAFSLPVALLIEIAATVVANSYFGAPVLFFFFHAWLKRPPTRPTTPCFSQIAEIAIAGIPNQNMKIFLLIAAYLAFLLALLFG